MKKLFLFAVILLTISCTKEQNISSDTERPYEPWVFRSVIDEVPRAISFALGNDLWVSYSAENASLYKAWKGSVDFDGAVYTAAHGPQPKIIGDAYIHNKYKEPWIIVENDDTLNVKASYKGHLFKNGRAFMNYELVLENGKSIELSESPEIIENENGKIGFERIFNIISNPDNLSVGLKCNFSSILLPSSISTTGNLQKLQSNELSVGKITALEMDAQLWLNQIGETSLITFFDTEPLIKNTLYVAENTPANSIDEGLKLLSKSDCRTCHNLKVKTIGPSYTSISNRYANTTENVTYLLAKIKNGGSGIWGQQVMTAHPDLPDADIKKMLDYILKLVPENEKNDLPAKSNSSISELVEPADVEESNLILGSMVSVYNIPEGTQKLPDFSELGRPVMGGLMPNFDNISDSKFVDLKDYFAFEGEGYIEIKDDLTTIFRIWSDDGSKLYINDQIVIDHDGLHGTSSNEAELSLKAGFHKFKVEYFNATGGKFFSLNWKPSNKSAFEVIPREIIYHDRTRQEKIRDLVLPMANASRIPGDKTLLTEVHPSFNLTQARPDNFTPKVGGMDFLSDGRLVVSTWDPEGAVFILENVDSKNPSNIKVKKIAVGLAEPLGLKVVDDEIYVMQKQELTKLIDHDGDDIIDEYETIANDWTVSTNFHEFGFGLEYKEGFFYAALAIAIMPGGASANPQMPDRGKAVKINKETGDVEFIAQGLRTPNGIGIGVDEELFIADNQGDWLPSSKILHVTEEAFFGSRAVDFEGTENLKEKAPVVWLPQDEIGNSPTTPSYLNLGPYKGQMIHGEVTNGGVKRVFVEKVNGEYQGAVFRFIQGLEAGVNRLTWGPDEALYIGGIGNPGNWQQTEKNWYGLQRLEYNEKSTFEMLAIRAKTNGIEIEFTEALRPGEGWNKDLYDIQQWYYKPTREYGGPKLNEKSLIVRSVNISQDRTKVFLELSGMKKGHVIYVHLNEFLISDNGNDLWSTEAWYTMNNIPENLPGFKASQAQGEIAGLNELSEEEVKRGWKLLFDGKSLDSWRNYGKASMGNAWKIENGTITLDSKAEGRGDIITKEEYEDFELELEWKISNCGNSGIIYFVHESDDYKYVWETGPEMQILDNTCHPDTKYPTHRAGDLYDLVESKYPMEKPAGNWNKVRIVSKSGKVEHWLNGKKVVEIEMFNEDWKRRIENSKFKDMPGFGTYRKGHIALQDHDDKVWFRNIKIREI